MILCPLCNKSVVDRRGLSNHLSTKHKHQFTNEIDKERLVVYTLFGENYVEKITSEYVEEKYCVYELPIDIVKYISLLGFKRSSKDERKTNRYKKKYLEGIQKKYGEDITNISQVAEIKEKKRETSKKQYGSYEEYLAAQRKLMRLGYDSYKDTDGAMLAKDNRENTCLERYGNKNFGQGFDAKEKSKQTRKKTISSWEYQERLERTKNAREAVTQRGGYSSKPEKRVRKILIDLDIDVLYNQFLWKYSWDIVFDKTIIEVQGTMWHAKPDIYKETDLIMGKILAKDIWEKDKRKQKKAKDEGYTVIEIWEDEIVKKSDEDLLILIKNRLIENGYTF
jgi:G:T-mismatch repair DNA endonuclease (very short patch repair protein)